MPVRDRVAADADASARRLARAEAQVTTDTADMKTSVEGVHNAGAV